MGSAVLHRSDLRPCILPLLPSAPSARAHAGCAGTAVHRVHGVHCRTDLAALPVHPARMARPPARGAHHPGCPVRRCKREHALVWCDLAQVRVQARQRPLKRVVHELYPTHTAVRFPGRRSLFANLTP